MKPSARLRLVALEDRTAPSAAYGHLPLAFEANHGQADTGTDFLARGDGYALALGPTGATLGLRHAGGGDVLRLHVVGANPDAPAAGADELVTKTNYLIGDDPSQWRTNVPNYGKVTYDDVYPGIDLVYYGNQGQLEYDFVVAPGASPQVIQLSVEGAEGLRLNRRGDLVIHTAGGDVVQQAPVLYQEVGGVRRPVSGRFVLDGTEVRFRVGRYDHSRPLVIDPVLSYSTYLGGSGSEQAKAIAVDADGNAYVSGYTQSTNFPTTPGAVTPAFGGVWDAFVTKLDPTGTQALYSTYLGGNSSDQANGIAVDAAGHAYVTGSTLSGNFPVTAGAFQANPMNGAIHAFVAKLNPTGTGFVYSTYLGGTDGYDSLAKGVAVDAAGSAFVTGYTASAAFALRNPIQGTHADEDDGESWGYYDAFVAKLNPAGSDLVYSTFLGGADDDFGYDIAVDAAGSAYVAGFTAATHPIDPTYWPRQFPTTPGAFQSASPAPGGGQVPFVTKLTPDGSAWAYSTFLGGGSGYDYGDGIAVDAAGSAYVTGGTRSADFPTTDGALDRSFGGEHDAFVTKLNPAGSGLVYSTYLGAGGTDQGRGIAVDGAGNAVVTGHTSSADFPVLSAAQPAAGGNGDAFVTRLNADGSAVAASTFLGGMYPEEARGVALDPAGNVYVTGVTNSPDYPTTAGAFQPTRPGTSGDEAFVAKLDLTPPAFSLTIDDVTVTEGHGGTAAAVFTVTRSGDPSIGFTVSYASASGTAAAGTDYQAAAGTLVFAAGEVSQTIMVAVTGDRLGEADETFVVTLGAPSAGAVADGQGLGTITDDEPRVSIGDVTRVEGRDGTTTLFTFTVSLSVAYDQPVTMSFRTANGTAITSNKDYTAASGTLTFAPGETSRTITIVVKGDNRREGNETFFVDLTGLSANAAFTRSRGIGTILNDD